MKHLLLCISTALFLFLLPAAGAATVRLQISGDADEPISEGRNYNLLYDSDRGSLVYVNYPTAGTVLEFNLWYNVTGEETTSLLGFTTVGLGTPLVTGTYDNATSVHFAHVYPHLNKPGVSFSFHGRAIHTIEGSFTISEMTVSPSGQLLTFAASFEQSYENNPTTLRGTVRYDLNPVPEPSAAVLLGALALGAMGLRGRRR